MLYEFYCTVASWPHLIYNSESILSNIHIVWPRTLQTTFHYNIICHMWMNRVGKSHEILMFVCLKKDAQQWCDITMFDCSHCSGCQPFNHCITGCWPEEWLQSSFVMLQLCLAPIWISGFWKETSESHETSKCPKCGSTNSLKWDLNHF